MFDEPFKHIAVRIPRGLVNRNWRTLGQRGCFQLTPKDPLGRIAAAALDASAASIARMSDDDLAIAIENVVDLFAAGAGKSHGSDTPSHSHGADITFARARAIIQARLKDCDLRPDSIAAELRISRRTLNKLFEKEGLGPMEYVILERLEQAARDLSSPMQRSLSVSEIAFRWGFKNTSHFAKRFRQHFGKMPSDLRHS
jgi:AraC-like DNA-binding protein